MIELCRTAQLQPARASRRDGVAHHQVPRDHTNALGAVTLSACAGTAVGLIDSSTEVALVLGMCAPERHTIARMLSSGGSGAVIGEDVPAREVAARLQTLVRDFRTSNRIVIECPSATSSTDVIARFTGAHVATEPPVTFGPIVTVVDASHLMFDLDRRDYVEGEDGQPFPVPWAQVTVTQIENATVLPIVNWRHFPRAQLTELLALLSHLNPSARLKLVGSGWARQVYLDWNQRATVGGTAGWIRILRDQHEPHVRDPRVSSFRYEQLRPLHPGRVAQTLVTQFDREEVGHIVRSVGLCRIASRPAMVGKWEQAGAMITFAPLAPARSPAGQSLGQEIAFIGFDLNPGLIRSRLDSCALTEDEFTAGPAAWVHYPDPIPHWDPRNMSR